MFKSVLFQCINQKLIDDEKYKDIEKSHLSNLSEAQIITRIGVETRKSLNPYSFVGSIDSISKGKNAACGRGNFDFQRSAMAVLLWICRIAPKGFCIFEMRKLAVVAPATVIHKLSPLVKV